MKKWDCLEVPNRLVDVKKSSRGSSNVWATALVSWLKQIDTKLLGQELDITFDKDRSVTQRCVQLSSGPPMTSRRVLWSTTTHRRRCVEDLQFVA